MEASALVEKLAGTIVEEPSAAVVALCCRLLGSGLGRGSSSSAAGGTARLVVDERFGRRAALRFEELRLRLRGGAVVDLLCELSQDGDRSQRHRRRADLALRSVNLRSSVNSIFFSEERALPRSHVAPCLRLHDADR